MAIDLTAYATASEYRDRNGRVSSEEDTTLATLLATISRVVDRRIGVAPGMFKPQTALMFQFDGTGGRTLRLRDERGSQYLLRTITADSLKVDFSLSGVYDDYLLDFADTWVQGVPSNAIALGEPYTAIELLPWSSATLLVWPPFQASIQITGDWGWAATPGAIKERVIGIARELVQVHLGGPNVDEVAAAIDANYGARSLMALLEQEYRYKIAAFA